MSKHLPTDSISASAERATASKRRPNTRNGSSRTRLKAIYAVVLIGAIHLKVRHRSGATSTAACLISGYGGDGNDRDVRGVYGAGGMLGLYMAPGGIQSGRVGLVLASGAVGSRNAE